MDAWDLLDPQLRGFFEASQGPGLSAESLPGLRAMIAKLSAGSPLESEACASAEHWIDGDEGQRLRVRVFRPRIANADAAGLLHFHPGGWVLGVPEMSAAALLEMVERLGCVIVSVDYRLAPEHPFPAAADDAWLALDWMTRRAADLGIKGPTALVGESAGATIAAALALRARDRGVAGIAIQALLYGAFDDRAMLRPGNPYAGRIGFGQDSGRFAWEALLAHPPGGEEISPYAAPARAERLDGLPPTFLAVGALDPFIDDNLKFAKRLIAAGVTSELHVYPGAPHGFDRVWSAGITQRMRRDRLAALSRALRPAG